MTYRLFWYVDLRDRVVKADDFPTIFDIARRDILTTPDTFIHCEDEHGRSYTMATFAELGIIREENA